MSKKSELEKKIQDGEAEISELERKRMRSQSAIFAAQLNNTPINETDVEYFRVFTNVIELKRKEIQQYQTKLNALS